MYGIIFTMFWIQVVLTRLSFVAQCWLTGGTGEGGGSDGDGIDYFCFFLLQILPLILY